MQRLQPGPAWRALLRERARAYSPEEYNAKLAWTAALLRETGASLIGFQEIFHVDALQALANQIGGGIIVHAPGATRAKNERDGRALWPKVGLVSAHPVEDVVSISEIPAAARFNVPLRDPDSCVERLIDLAYDKFERPVLKARVRLPGDIPCTVFVCHLKSKRPLFLQDEEKTQSDPLVRAKAAIRALIKRGAEAAGLRALVLDVIRDKAPGERGMPCVVMGDLNDAIGAVTTQVVSGEPPHQNWDKNRKQRSWDVLLYNVFDIQARQSLETYAYSYIWNGRHELLDHILVSQEFHRQFPNRIGEVVNARVYNDHLVDKTMTGNQGGNNGAGSRVRSDHGVPVVEIRLNRPNP